MKPADALELLREFYRDKSAMRERHAAAARLVGDYDFNNTYQYIIAREDLQRSWLRDAILDLGGTPDEASEPKIDAHGRRDDAQKRVITEDGQGAQAFVDRWRPRVEAMTNARNKIMLDVILGETLEHKRFFDQALAGRTDLLGRRADGAGTKGAVLPTRWVE
ncbi:MAG TPA: hypothetical protein VGL62_06765 [Vicinamibacterales bacterium]